MTKKTALRQVETRKTTEPSYSAYRTVGSA